MTTPASTWRNAYITSRLPYSSGTTGQICSAPFVLNKALGTATADPDRPFEIANGLLTDNSYANIIPIAVPAEYAILETWMVIVTASHAIVDADTLPTLNIYGKTSFGDQHDGNMPDDYATITDWPANLREWWMPLPMTDRANAGNTGAANSIFTGINQTATVGGLDAEPGTGSHMQSAFGFRAHTIPVPNKNAATANSHSHVAKIGDGTGVAAYCYPAQTFFLNGSDTILTTVTTALDEDSGGTNFDGGAFLMGRFHG